MWPLYIRKKLKILILRSAFSNLDILLIIIQPNISVSICSVVYVSSESEHSC